MTAVALASVALAALCLAFAGLYFFARRIDNYGIVDVAWSYAFAPVAWFYAFAGPGWLPRRLLVAVLVTLWATRLGTHLLRRVASHHPTEDGRYVQLRRDWAGNFAPKMFGFFQLQAGSIIMLAVPFLLPVINPLPTFSLLEIAGGALWACALAGESISDAQLSAFKRNPANRGRVCDAGLWRFSRHPNYFFEWMVWVAYALVAFSSPSGWLVLLAPASILFLLLRVTGIPLTEAQLLRSKGAAYRRYQQTTSAFVPWFPRRLP